MPGGMCAASEVSSGESIEEHALDGGLQFVLQELATYAGKPLEVSKTNQI